MQLEPVLAPLLASLAGGLLGLLFFGGLWWTLRRALGSPRPALWIGGSLIVRMAGVAAGFVGVSGGDWRRLLACLLGFLAARWWVVHRTKRLATETTQAVQMPLERARGGLHGNATASQECAERKTPARSVQREGSEAI